MSEVIIQTPATEAPAAAAAPAANWIDGFRDENKALIQRKGYAGPEDVVDAYRNFEKLYGVPQERILKLPESMDAPEARAVWERLGAPKDPKDYKLETPKESDPKFYEHMATVFHDLAVPKEMAQKILAKQNEYQETLKAQNLEAEKFNQSQADLALKKEWGMAYDQNRQVVDQAARTLGITSDEVTAMGKSLGVDKAMKFLLKLGTSVGEHSFVSGGAPNNGMLAPEQARNRIMELRNDQNFREKLLRGDVEAKKQWDQAHRMAHPGEFQL